MRPILPSILRSLFALAVLLLGHEAAFCASAQKLSALAVEGESAGSAPAAPPPSAQQADANKNKDAGSLVGLCHSLMASALENDLPVAFFANLIWQESRLRHDAVSRVGALGIAQFMPRVALAFGVDDPFDPRQALPASARMLHDLREHFGNLGFVAAAYNAGAHRVSEWLERGRGLPRETRNYVVSITGRSVEEWRRTPPEDDALTFTRQLPCRALRAYADIEEAQRQARLLQEDQTEPAGAPQAAPTDPHETTVEIAKLEQPEARPRRFAVLARFAHRRFLNRHPRREVTLITWRSHGSRHEAAHRSHPARRVGRIA